MKSNSENMAVAAISSTKAASLTTDEIFNLFEVDGRVGLPVGEIERRRKLRSGSR